MKISLLTLILILCLPQFLMAQSASGTSQKLLLLDATAQFGYGSVKAASDTSSPSIGNFTLCLAAGVNIKKFSLGAEYDYRILTQFTDTDPMVGNRRGTFASPLSIFVRLNFEVVKFGFTMINSGVYDLMNTTAGGQKVSYLKPSGFQFNVNFKKFRHISPGLFYESVSFSDTSIDGVTSTMANKVNYTTFGVGARYGF